MDTRLDSLEGNFDIMMSVIDGIAKDLQIGKTEKAALDHAIIRHEQKIDNHEVRIKNPEQRKS